MRYLRYDSMCFNNGEGLRAVLYVSGCAHACPGCHNPVSWKRTNGEEITEEFVEQILEDLIGITGFTLTGGDPFHPKNVEGSLALLKRIKEYYPEKDIWVWTGYLFEELKPEWLEHIDVVVDGPYRKELKPLPWRGSSNQKIWRKSESGDWSSAE